MPTGYTAGILDGKITTFPQFAKQCMRAFGATIHMRDDDMDAEYEERTPSDYHLKAIDKAKQSLIDAEILLDEVIVANKKKELEENKKYHIKGIEKANIDAKNMNAILKEVNAWQPPTSAHTGMKDFMADQIVKTIDFDCKTKYHDEGLVEVEKAILNINAKSIRAEMIAQANKDLKYHTKEYKADVERCEKSNQWVKQLMKSF